MFSDVELAGYLADFGQPVVVDGVTITAVFRRQFVESLDVEGERPTLLCRSSDVSSVVHGDAVTVNAASYTVYGIEPRDDGLTLLILKESS
jgi:hypothetical protein